MQRYFIYNDRKTQCCKCDNVEVTSISEFIGGQPVISYYCKTHNPTNSDYVKYTNNIGEKVLKEINSKNKCELCLYEEVGNIMMCPICKSVTKKDKTFEVTVFSTRIPRYGDKPYSYLKFSN